MPRNNKSRATRIAICRWQCNAYEHELLRKTSNNTHLPIPQFNPFNSTIGCKFFQAIEKKKKRWENSLLDFRCKNGIRAITKSEICPLLKTALDNFDSMEIACSLLTYLLKLISKEWFVLMVSRNCKLCFNVGKPIDSR